jgi:ComF family protein
MPNEFFSDRISESFFPTTCSFCRQRYPPAETPFDGVCRRCLNQLPMRKGAERLVRLRAASDDVPAAVCACYYEGIVQKALIRMKFGDSPEVCATFADLITDALLRTHPHTSAFTAVVAVPLHAAREKERGYNQAALIASSISRRLLLPDWSGCLVRGRATGRQSELLTLAERQHNVANAFAVISPERIRRRHLILVDDILSTGATLLSLRQTILQAGAASVTMVAAASGNTGPLSTD